jgi:hypothetical protein
MSSLSRWFLIALLVVLVVSTLACGGGSNSRPAVTHVYAAGFEENDAGLSIAKYWKDGQSVLLGQGINGSFATSIAVSGENVYVAGVEGNGTNDVAKYWRNGIPVELTDGTQRGYAKAITVSGTDVYVAGAEQTPGLIVAKVWKNGVAVVLPDLGEGALAHSIFVSGNDVYVAGRVNKRTQIDPTHVLFTQVATYWKNGVPTQLSDGRALSIASSIFVSGDDVYVGGFACQDLSPDCALASYWKNGVQVQLTNTTGSAASSVFIAGPDVYVAGNEANNLGALWKNGVRVELMTSSSGSAANQVIVSGGDVFVAGAVVNTSAVPVVTYWKNGIPVSISDGTHLGSAFALAVVRE